ncbi:MAG: D-glycero-alpha-D-manno-heptose-1,7-bisphosphate 7-phosphatase [Sedimentisphaeraceae bacterium JB056]
MSENEKIRAVFLDRDDTIVDDPGYITKPEQVKLLPGVGDALRRLRLLGYKLIIVTNQSAVARGMITEDDLSLINNKLLSLLDAKGIKIEKVYYCPFHPEGIIEEYKKESYLRKPNPGMLFTARDEMDIDLEASWMIGDSFRDVSAGKAAGCHTILINPPLNPRKKGINDPAADYEAVNIKEAANIVKMYHQKDRGSNQTAVISKEKVHTPSKQPVQESPMKNVQHLGSGEIPKLLKDIRQAIISANAAKKNERFSILKAVGGALTAIAVMCIIIALIKVIGSEKQDLSVLKPLGFAACFQLVAIMLYIVNSDSKRG